LGLRIGGMEGMKQIKLREREREKDRKKEMREK
jgi:hypothetical protein